MQNINLLPEELRKKEEQERRFKKPKVFEIELVKPKTVSTPLFNPFKKPRAGWTRMFEKKNQPAPPAPGQKPEENPKIEEQKRLVEEKSLAEQKMRFEQQRRLEEQKKAEEQKRIAIQRMQAQKTAQQPKQEKEQQKEERIAAKITLIPQRTAPLTPQPPKILTYLVPFLISVFIIVFFGGGMFLTTKILESSINKLSAQKQELSNRNNQTEASLQSAFSLLNQTILGQRLLKEHDYLSRLFNFLEENTIPDTAYQNLIFSGAKTVSLQVLNNNFSKAAEQLLVFLQAKDFLSDLTFNRFAREKTDLGERVRFDLQFNLLPEVLK